MDRCRWVRVRHLGVESVRELARRFGEKGVTISDVTIGRYEKDREPPLGYVRDLAKLAGISIVWLVTGEGDPLASLPGEAEWRIENVRAALDAPYPSTSSNGEDPPAGSVADVQAGSEKLLRRTAEPRARKSPRDGRGRGT